jgi:26 proteasome complex subunit DSS1
MASAATKDDKAPAADSKPEAVTDPKPAAALEEDDEFEDFPVDGTPNPYVSAPKERRGLRASCTPRPRVQPC